MANYITTESDLTQVANAIRAKGNTSAQLEYPDDFVTAIQDLPAPGVIQEDGQGNITLPETGDALVISQLTVTQNGTYTAAETAGYNPVIVNVGQSVEEKDVNFIDYDGTILYSYTASEFANLSALPDNPSHEDLIAQGWNWSLSDAKTYVASYGKLWIGQMYITKSGDTEIDVELHAPRLSPYLSLVVGGTIEVDWGDGTAKSTITQGGLPNLIMEPHVYATDGSYTIKIHVVSGVLSPSGTSACPIFSGNFSSASNNRVYASNVKRVRIGSSVTVIDMYAFQYCSSLTSIAIPSSVTTIGRYAFRYCYSLASIAIPNNITSISMNTFQDCSSLASIAISSSVTNIDHYAFQNCYSLVSIAIPSNITSMSTQMFEQCYSLTLMTIPSGVTSINTYAFRFCYGLGLIRFEPTTPPTVSNSNAWTGLPSDCVIFVPVDSYYMYTVGTNYPSNSTYTYIGFKTYANGASLPTSYSCTSSDQSVWQDYLVTWYATKKDAINQTNAITVGNGKEIYAKMVENGGPII